MTHIPGHIDVEASSAEVFMDLSLRQRILFDRLDNRTLREVVKTYRKLKREIEGELKKIDPTLPERAVHKVARLEKALVEVNSLISQAQGTIMGGLQLTLEDIGKLALTETGKDLMKALPFSWTAEIPAPQLVKEIVNSQPFIGATLREWNKGLRESTIQQVGRELRAGLLSGEGIDSLSRRSARVLDVKSSQMLTLVRTSALHVANRARDVVIDANIEVVKEKIWDSALDSQVCPICRPNHGKRFDPGSAPPLPVHPNCRCVYILRFKRWGELTRDAENAPQAQKFFTIRTPQESWKKSRIKNWLTRQGVKYEEGDTKKDLLRRSGEVTRGYESRLRGITDMPKNFYEWAKKQPDFAIRELFGPVRFRLWKEGKANLQDFARPGGFGELSLEALARKLKISREEMI